MYCDILNFLENQLRNCLCIRITYFLAVTANAYLITVKQKSCNIPVFATFALRMSAAARDIKGTDAWV